MSWTHARGALSTGRRSMIMGPTPRPRLSKASKSSRCPSITKCSLTSPSTMRTPRTTLWRRPSPRRETFGGIWVSNWRTEAEVPRRCALIDVGCGRGDTVAWLCAQGWDAYGIDISPEYIERGREYLAREGANPERLQLLNDDFTYPFPDSMFYVVLSDQVIEHVADLDLFASEVARISAPGACGLHNFPARWRPIETHLLSPFVHWLPKGPLRRAAVAASLRIGLAAPYFREFSFWDRVEIFSRFSEEETFYRSLRSTIATMERHGLRCDARLASQDKIRMRLPTTPKAALPLLGWLYRHMSSAALQTHKPGR